MARWLAAWQLEKGQLRSSRAQQGQNNIGGGRQGKQRLDGYRKAMLVAEEF